MATANLTTTPVTIAAPADGSVSVKNTGNTRVTLINGAQRTILKRGRDVNIVPVAPVTAEVTASDGGTGSISYDVSAANGASGVTVYANEVAQGVNGAAAGVSTGLSGTYEPLPVRASGSPVIAPAATDAAIRAAASALAALGGGTVRLPDESITLSSPLPLLSGVRYEGVAPVLYPAGTVVTGTWLEDEEWNYVGGTRFVGNGTFAAFEGNAVDLASPDANIGINVIRNCAVVNVGLDNFTYGVRCGAANLIGPAWSEFRNIWVKNCSQWGIYIVNMAHCTFGGIRTCLCQNGMYFAVNLPGTVFAPGNSVFDDELYVLNPRDGRDNRKCRGIVFDATGAAAGMGAIQLARAQVNNYNRAKLSVTASFTSGSTSVTVPDGTQFLPGYLVSFTATGNGFTAGQVYYVTSVAGNAITLANAKLATDISATATGTLTLETFGFANFEVVAQTTLAKVNGCNFAQLDLEGSGSAALYAERAENCRFVITALPAAGNALRHIVARDAQNNQFTCHQSATTDLDASSSVASSVYGIRSTMSQRAGIGVWRDGTLSTVCLSLNSGNTAAGGDMHVRSNGFIYPAAGMGRRIYTRDFSITLNGSMAGVVVFNGGTGQTFTLPTIVTDAGAANAAIVGLVFEITNVTANTLTVATDGTQLFNQVGGKVSLTVASQATLTVIAAKNNSGTLFWVAIPGALA